LYLLFYLYHQLYETRTKYYPKLFYDRVAAKDCTARSCAMKLAVKAIGKESKMVRTRAEEKAMEISR
jgi:hypothetical protein